MGNYLSPHEPVKDNEPKSEIELLLSQLKSNNTSNDEFKIIKRHQINLKEMKGSLETMKFNETFEQFNTYQMIYDKMPIFVVSKQKVNETEIDYNFGAPTYYDVYGSSDKIKETLISFISNDIIDIVLQYCGDGEFLFSMKKRDSGAMTLSTKELFIGDALTISHTYSEKSGQSGQIKINDKYDKKLYMYLGWIIHELSQFNHRIWWGVNFNFNAFMRYEILGHPRPPPPTRTYCIVGDCMVLMDAGYKRVRDIRAGDVIKTSNGCLVKVICTVTQRINDVIEICKIGECYITPEHPIRKCGSTDWKIPYKEVECRNMYVDVVNNFILESEHHVVVDNVECITLGHMFSDPAVKHPVWGTEVICKFLKSLPSYPDVVIDGTLKVAIEEQVIANL